MRPDPNREMMRQVALQLGDLTEQLVFVGGVTAGLLITDPGAPTVRPTQDVDVIAVIESHTDYYRLSELLRQRGFSEDRSEGAPMCRWISGGWQLDVMPTDESILGFSNRWYGLAASTAETMVLVKLMENDDFIQALPGHILEENRLPVVKSRLKAIAWPAMTLLANQAQELGMGYE